MSLVISTLIFLVLLTVSGLHLAWALGSTFPARDEQSLSKAAGGFKDAEKMPPPLASLLVAIATFAAAVWPFMMRGSLGSFWPNWLVSFGAIVLVLVFLGRGVAGYTRWMRNICPEEPFATLNRRYYSPLCLIIGAGFLVLAIERFS